VDGFVSGLEVKYILRAILTLKTLMLAHFRSMLHILSHLPSRSSVLAESLDLLRIDVMRNLDDYFYMEEQAIS
jgi:hypothetical protein